MQNFIYALIQILHNFGAVAIVGVAALSVWMLRDDAGLGRRLALLVALAWATQALSGLMFGLLTYYFEHHLPDIHGIAVAALITKMACATCGLVLSGYLTFNSHWGVAQRHIAWCVLFTLGVIALSSAAFLRWFS